MFKLNQGENIISAVRPDISVFNRPAGHRCAEEHCGRIPYRMIVIQSSNFERQVGLCGIHFHEACRYFPELYVRDLAS